MTKNSRKKVAIIGSAGVPAKYGGFETLAEYLAASLAEDYDTYVYCSGPIYQERPKELSGARLIYLPFRANRFQGILYDIVSILNSLIRHDVLIILGSPAGFMFPLRRLFGKKLIFNFGGLDFKRSKWNALIKFYIKSTRRMAVMASNVVIADNVGIQEFIQEEYNKTSTVIPYGADHVEDSIQIREVDRDKYPFIEHQYMCAVARIQKDNNIEMILEAYLKSAVNMPLVIIGNWVNSSYGIALREKYNERENIYLLDAIYDQKLLNCIRGNATVYLHGHSAGGTNPSLVEAMYLKRPVLCFGSVFNRYSTNGLTHYFSNADELSKLLSKLDEEERNKIAHSLKKYADSHYNWALITAQYKSQID